MSFQKPGLDEDVVKLRYKHHRNRMFDTVNRVIEERSRVKDELLVKSAHKRSSLPVEIDEPVSPKAVTTEKSKKLTSSTTKQSLL
jgi:hypothetical protein